MVLIINVMLAYRAVHIKRLEGIAVFESPYNYIVYGINTVTLDIVLKNYTVLITLDSVYDVSVNTRRGARSACIVTVYVPVKVSVAHIFKLVGKSGHYTRIETADTV